MARFDKAGERVEAILDKAAEGVEAVRDKAAGGVEAIIDKAGEAVEVVDKVEEPGVDAKVVEGRIDDIDRDLARSQLLEEIRRPEESCRS